MKLDERALGLWRNTRAGHGTTLVINRLILSTRKLSYQSLARPPLSASATSSKWLIWVISRQYFSRPALPFDGSSKNNRDAYHQSRENCAQRVIVHPHISRNSYSGSLKIFTRALAYVHARYIRPEFFACMYETRETKTCEIHSFRHRIEPN